MSNEFIDPELENWVDSQQKLKGSWRRVSVLGCAILMASALIALIYPKASLYFEPTLDCGDITTRPERKKSDRIKLNHNTFCSIRGIVSDLRVFSTEQDVDGPNKKPTKIPPIEKLDGVRYFSKLAGDRVFIILDAQDPAVYAHRLKRRGDGLLGYNVDQTGRLFDPDKSSRSMKNIGLFLKANFGLKSDQAIMIFDTTDVPSSHFNHLIALIVSILGLMLAMTLTVKEVLAMRR